MTVVTRPPRPARNADGSVVRNGAGVSIATLRNHVSSGSDVHCLFGDDLTHAVTSSTVGAENSENEESGHK